MYESLRQSEVGFDVRVWPGLDKVSLQHTITLGVDPEKLPPQSTEAQPRPGLRIPVSFRSDFFNLPPEKLSFKVIKAQVSHLKLSARNVMLLYIKEDVDRAVQMLASWEATPNIAQSLFIKDRIKTVVWDAREFLQSVGRLRTTPEGWTDPFNYGQFMEAKRQKVENRLLSDFQAVAKTATVKPENRIRQGPVALSPADFTAAKASLMPALINFGPLPPLPPGETQKARNRSARKRRAREYKRLEELGLRDPSSRRPRISNSTSSAPTNVGPAGDHPGSGPEFDLDMPSEDSSMTYTGVATRVIQPPFSW
jgi:hypothetical protein